MTPFLIDSSRVIQAARLTLVAVCLASTFGCSGSIAGYWRMIEAKPNRDVFMLDQVEFTRDGAYNALVAIDGKSKHETGAYEFNGFKLTLRPRAGGQRKFDAALRIRTLQVIDAGRRVTLKKAKKPKPQPAVDGAEGHS